MQRRSWQGPMQLGEPGAKSLLRPIRFWNILRLPILSDGPIAKCAIPKYGLRDRQSGSYAGSGTSVVRAAGGPNFF